MNWKMTAGFVLLSICKFVFLWYLFFTDNYISFFLFSYEMWGFSNKWCEKTQGISRFFDITHEIGPCHRFWYTEKLLNKKVSSMVTLVFSLIYLHNRYLLTTLWKTYMVKLLRSSLILYLNCKLIKELSYIIIKCINIKLEWKCLTNFVTYDRKLVILWNIINVYI